MQIIDGSVLPPSSHEIRGEDFVRSHALLVRNRDGTANQKIAWVLKTISLWAKEGGKILTPRGVELEMHPPLSELDGFVYPVNGECVFRELKHFKLLDPPMSFMADGKRTLNHFMAMADGQIRQALELKPFVRRHRRFEVICPQCCVPVKAPVPEVAKRSPFGPRLHGLALYLKSFHSVSFARLEGLFGDVFGLKLSQGALANMLHRGHRPFHKAKRKIVRHLRRANMVASDETGIRIEGLNGYHWIFLSETEVVHEAQLSRAAQVVRDVMGEHKPLLWLSDGYSAQQNHGHHHQTCLAHLARDVAYGLEASQDDVPFRLKLWLTQVFALARNIGTYAASTCKAKKRQLENTLADILLERPDCEVAETLRAKFARASPQLLTFLDFPGEVEVTNNACERGLRPAVIQRKNTNGFRSMWAARGDCAVRTVTDTAKLTGQPPFQTILATLG